MDLGVNRGNSWIDDSFWNLISRDIFFRLIFVQQATLFEFSISIMGIRALRSQY